MRRGNNEESPYCIVDRQDWQGCNKHLARSPYETQGTLVLDMIDCSSMAVDCQREGKEEETAEQPYDSKTMWQEDDFVVLHNEEILGTRLPLVNPALILQLVPYSVYHFTMERDTRQRRAIRRVIEEAGRPLSPQEVLKVAQVHTPRLGIATVYRTLKGLVAEGWLVQVELPGEPPRYETATKAHHHHFQCRICGQVYEIEGCPQNVQPLTPAGFLLEGHYMVLYGQCATCVDVS